MADLTTRDKRASAIDVFLPTGRVLPNPTGAVGAADRAQVAYAYSGEFTADTGGGGAGGMLDGRQSRRRRTIAFLVTLAVMVFRG